MIVNYSCAFIGVRQKIQVFTFLINKWKVWLKWNTNWVNFSS